MGTPTAIGVNDDFSTCEAGITLWTTNYEQTRRLDLRGVSMVRSYR